MLPRTQGRFLNVKVKFDFIYFSKYNLDLCSLNSNLECLTVIFWSLIPSLCVFLCILQLKFAILCLTPKFFGQFSRQYQPGKIFIKTKLTLTQSTYRTTSCPSVVERLMSRMLTVVRIMSKTGMAISADFVGQNSKQIPSYSATYSPNIPPDLMFSNLSGGKSAP